MKQFLNDILSKIERFSTRLDNETVITKQHWVVLDKDDKNKKVYIFRKDGSLLISVNGNVTKAKWELLDFENILLENNSNTYLFNHGFLDNEVLILKKDNSSDYFTLVSNILYDKGVDNILELNNYLTIEYIEKPLERGQKTEEIDYSEQSKELPKELPKEEKIFTFEETLNDNSKILIEKIHPYGPQKGARVFDLNKNPLPNGDYFLNENRKIKVMNKLISSVSHLIKYNVKEKGELLIEQQDINCAYKGDKVKLNGIRSVDGTFKISLIEKIYVKNGTIIKRKIFGL